MIGENIKMVARRFFRPTPTSTRSPRASERRVRSGGSWTDDMGRNIPDPWQKREWEKTRDIANLPAVVGNVLSSGPTKTMYGERLIQVNPDAFKRPKPFRGEFEYQAQKTLHESGVVAMDPRSHGIASSNPRRRYLSKEERIARAGPSDTHTVALGTRKLRRGDTEVLRGQDEEEVTRTIIGYLLDYLLGV